MTRRDLDPWIEGYLSYLGDVRRMAARTIVDIRCTLRKVSKFTDSQKKGKPLWKLSLEDYLHWLNEERATGRSEAVLAKQISHLRGLLDYAWRSGRSDRNVLDGFSLQDRIRQKAPRVLTLEEARNLVFSCSSRTAVERRSRLIILLLYGCGLRTSELCNLDVQDVDIERQEVFIRRAKGDRQRRIPVPGTVWTQLLAYLTERGGKRGPLFRTQAKHKRISKLEVGMIVKTAADHAGIEGKVTPRTLRHTFGTHLMDRGIDLPVIASLMGHRSPKETGVYLHVLPGKTEAAVQTLFKEKGERQ
ncbi:tyrosine-type recombinase/integrase [Verrucomicrobiota bacterium]